MKKKGGIGPSPELLSRASSLGGEAASAVVRMGGLGQYMYALRHGGGVLTELNTCVLLF